MNLGQTVKTILHALETKDNGQVAQINVIDALGWDALDIFIAVGVTDVAVTAKVEESDDNSSWSDVAGTTITPLTATDDNSLVAIHLALADRKRYLRCLPTAGDATGAAICVLAQLSEMQKAALSVAEAQFGETIDV
jgi:hypothetical protein